MKTKKIGELLLADQEKGHERSSGTAIRIHLSVSAQSGHGKKVLSYEIDDEEVI